MTYKTLTNNQFCAINELRLNIPFLVLYQKCSLSQKQLIEVV